MNKLELIGIDHSIGPSLIKIDNIVFWLSLNGYGFIEFDEDNIIAFNQGPPQINRIKYKGKTFYEYLELARLNNSIE